MLQKIRALLSTPTCDHVPLTHADARAEKCEECGSHSSLRICSTCGHVGCCDSQARHARAHYQETGHPVMRAKTWTGKGFVWCYPDKRYVSDKQTEAA